MHQIRRNRTRYHPRNWTHYTKNVCKPYFEPLFNQVQIKFYNLLYKSSSPIQTCDIAWKLVSLFFRFPWLTKVICHQSWKYPTPEDWYSKYSIIFQTSIYSNLFLYIYCTQDIQKCIAGSPVLMTLRLIFQNALAPITNSNTEDLNIVEK